ncbi:hypothetical protein HC031_25840 [Planosporangium thailandense]|uniref:Uncharacterized protein n=1 Tax=Planosporangium thailandense TaxID=765197 RepID=A0ABX0Y503_9ACTN|nr:hypothetical protein [Planosporangium thailandense]NJC73113.1 hypothetical protein [Planosporangium thailandense]
MPAVDRSTSNGHNDTGKVHFITGAGTTTALVSLTGDRTNVAPAGVSADQTGVDIPPGAAAVDSDVASLTGVSRTPRGPRAPPFLTV